MKAHKNRWGGTAGVRDWEKKTNFALDNCSVLRINGLGVEMQRFRRLSKQGENGSIYLPTCRKRDL